MAKDSKAVFARNFLLVSYRDLTRARPYKISVKSKEFQSARNAFSHSVLLLHFLLLDNRPLDGALLSANLCHLGCTSTPYGLSDMVCYGYRK